MTIYEFASYVEIYTENLNFVIALLWSILTAIMRSFSYNIMDQSEDSYFLPHFCPKPPSIHSQYIHIHSFLFKQPLVLNLTVSFDLFKSTMSQQHGYNARNGYMPVISKPRTEWGKNKTYHKALTDWASLPTELKKLMPKRIFKYKLKQFLLDKF